MNVTINYEELSAYISKEFMICPQFECVDEKSVRVMYKPGTFIPTVSVVIKVDGMRDDVICLSYDCSKPMAMIVDGAVQLLKEKMPDGVEVIVDQKRVNVFPERVEQLEKVLKYVRLKGIRFTEDAMCAELELQ